MAVPSFESRLPFATMSTQGPVRWFADFGRRLQTWRDRRRTIAALRQLTPAQLDDIGLTPGAVDNYWRNGRI